MNKSPVFTVIVPTYNREKLLKRTIESILAQTFKDFELIIVDDGSTDNTKKLIASYKDCRIIYIYKENGGLNSARNKGLQNAKGEYIAFCDSDDSWLPEKLEKHVQKYNEDNEIKVVYDLTGVVKKEGDKQNIILARNDICEGWCYKEVLEQGYLTSPTFLSCKKECFEKIGSLPMDLTNCEDDEFCFRLCKYFKVGLVKEILGVYHSDATNRISIDKKLCADDFLKFQEKMSAEIMKVCGKKVLSNRYFHASYKYLAICEIDTAKEIFGQACRIQGVTIEEIKSKVINELLKDDEVIIYGIGNFGMKVYNALKLVGFSDFIFAITNIKQEPLKINDVQVKQIESLKKCIDKTIVIASSKYYDEMKTIALKKGFIRVVSYKKIIETIFDNSFSVEHE